MYLVNSVMVGLFGLLLLPFEGMDPWAGMVWISLLTAFFMLFVFKLTSNQAVVRSAKDAIKAHLLEMRLYNDNPRVMIAAERDIMKANLRYIAANTKPLVVMMVPLVLVLAQLNLRFDSDTLRPGEQVLVKMKMKAGFDPMRVDPVLVPPSGLELSAPPVRISDEGEVVWRMRALTPGEYVLRFTAGGAEMTKSARVGGGPIAAVPARAVSRSILDQALYPGDHPLPSGSPADMIEISYRPRRLTLFGMRIHWLVAFFGLSMVMGFGFKGIFKVDI